MNIDLNRLDSDPMAMIYHYGTLFVNFHPDLCTIYHHLVKIDAHVCSAMKSKNNHQRNHSVDGSSVATHHYWIYSEATFYKIQLN